MDDEKLFSLFQTNNDEKAFGSLYERYNRKVLSYCIHAIGDRDIAKDVFQKVWYNIIANKSKFIEGSFIAWLMIITRNQCLMEKRNQKYTTEINENTLVTGTEGFSDVLEKEYVRSAIRKLPEDFREIIELKYFDEFSYEELAATLNISMALVKTRLYRAKKVLSELLKDIKEKSNAI